MFVPVWFPSRFRCRFSQSLKTIQSSYFVIQSCFARCQAIFPAAYQTASCLVFFLLSVFRFACFLSSARSAYSSLFDLGYGAFFQAPCLPRKEVIQPHLPIRLPCYDFTPVIDLTFGSCSLAVGSLTSGALNSHGVTGGVYKARERIHRGILIRDY